ncbi:MAG: hypothetical protein OEX04_13835 [Acidimicrobiia bacterium]|nr:hypothetical protein [Acidimicrobiia bacterium]
MTTHRLAIAWREPRRVIAEILSELTPGSHRDLGELIVTHRADTPEALWLAEQLRHSAPATIATLAADMDWVDRLALELTGYDRLAVVSHGPGTRAVVASVVAMQSEPPIIVAPNAVVARGLGDLEVDIEIDDPGAAPACLVPAAATSRDAVWTSPAGAAVLEAGNPRPMTVADPITALGSWAADRYRPPGWVVRCPNRAF